MHPIAQSGSMQKLANKIFELSSLSYFLLLLNNDIAFLACSHFDDMWIIDALRSFCWFAAQLTHFKLLVENSIRNNESLLLQNFRFCSLSSANETCSSTPRSFSARGLLQLAADDSLVYLLNDSFLFFEELKRVRPIQTVSRVHFCFTLTLATSSIRENKTAKIS